MKKVILILLTVIVVTVPPSIYFYTQSLLPQTDGSIDMPGLKSKVTIIRDKWGIPHIEAGNQLDLQRGLGFAMAQDRLFQMDLLRRIGNGQLSEIFGKQMVEFDKLLRTLRLRGAMDDYWKNNRHQIDPEMIALMEAFFEGVHHFIKTQPLPLEFQILGYTPKPFSPAEAMSVAGYLALSFCEGIIADPLYTDLMNQFPKDLVQGIYIRHENDVNNITAQDSVSFKLDDKWFNGLLDFHSTFRDIFGLFHGSNSWVLGPNRSKSGFALLANDPHVAFSNPSVWYEAHLKSPDYEIYGHFIPLVPFAGMGHNEERGWAVTMTEIDDFDVYQEKIHPDNPNKVMFKNEWVDMRVYEEVIPVRGGKPVKMKVRVTPHGPIIDDTKYGVKGKVLSAKWSYYHPENATAMAFFKLSRSRTMQDMYDAVAYGATPGINVSWVDKEGNIAWKVMGKVPLRKDFRGNQILEGWSGKHEYERYFSPEENPGLENPASGVIVTANYHPDYDGPLPIDGYWQPGERYERIYDLLKEQDKWSLEELKKVQNDQVVYTQYMVPILLSAIEKGETEQEIKALDKLRRWKGESGIDSIGSSVYHMWTHHLGKVATIDELGEKRFEALNKVADFWNFFKTFIKTPEHPWWDDTATQEVKESREDMIRKSFRIAVKRLEERLGPKVSEWKWGRLHTIEYEHPLGKVKPLNFVFNIGPLPAGGGFFQVDNMSTARYNDGFKVTLGPSTRRLVDFKDPLHSLGILPTGNSGHFNSPHFDDQARMFLRGEYRAQYMIPKEYKNGSTGTLTLNPI